MTSAEQAYLFRHALLRDAAYDLLTPSHRAALHHFVVGVVEDLFNNDVPSEYAHEMARHCRIAREHLASEPLRQKELHYAATAFSAAFRAYDFVSALELCRQAVAIAAPEERAQHLLKLARGYTMIGRRDEAGHVIEQLLSSTDSVVDPDTLAWTRMLKSSLLRAAGRMDEALALAELVITGLDSLKDSTRSAILGSHVLMLQSIGRHKEARDCEKLAFEAARAADAKATEVRLMINAVGPLRSAAKYDEAEAMARRALDLAREIHDLGAEAAAMANLGNVLETRGANDDAFELRTQALALARRVGDFTGECLHLSALASQLAQRNQWHEAEAHCLRAIEIGVESGSLTGDGFARFTLAQVLNDVGRHTEAAEHLPRAMESLRKVGQPVQLGEAQAELAVTQLALGETDAAAAQWGIAAKQLHGANAAMQLQRAEARVHAACVRAGIPPFERPETT
jgi:tetratricopeptide (TPR) repeat protein